MGLLTKKLSRALELQNNGQLEQAEALYLTILKKKPKYFDANQLLALCYHQQGQLEKSVRQYKKALQVNANHAAAQSNLGNVYMDLKQYALAQKQYEISLKLASGSAETHNNIANCYQKLRLFDKAYLAYQQAVTLEPNNAVFQENYGMSLTQIGKFDESLQALQIAYNLNPAASSVYLHLFYLLNAMHMTEQATNIAVSCMADGLLDKPQECAMRIGLAQIAWLSGDMENLARHLTASQTIMDGHDELNDIEALRSFHKYLCDLLPYRQQHRDEFNRPAPKTMVMIAESHGFAPNQTRIRYRDEDYQIRSFLVTGGKVWHMSQETNNTQQASLRMLLEKLPRACTIVLGFGEIDCRTNEGIFPAYLNKGVDFATSIPAMLDNYVKKMLAMAEPFQHQLIFYGVPAPHPEMFRYLSDEQQLAFLRMIRLFNEKLRQTCLAYRCPMLDIYSLTSDARGQSDLKWHFDKIHIHPKAFATLFQKYLIE
jgi:tetratricopeptide (TPR) repeat protein